MGTVRTVHFSKCRSPNMFFGCAGHADRWTLMQDIRSTCFLLLQPSGISNNIRVLLFG